MGHKAFQCPSDTSVGIKRWLIQFNTAEEAIKCSSVLSLVTKVTREGRETIFIRVKVDVESLDPLYAISKEEIRQVQSLIFCNLVTNFY
jgi:hypothetical protein